MSLPTLSHAPPLVIPFLPLTPSSFAPFGTVITSPLPPVPSNTNQETIPTRTPLPLHDSQPSPILANQNTALKTSPISPLINNYPPASATKPGSRPLMSLFTCFPRPTSSIHDRKLRVTVLERHPYTTQTFSPLGLPPSSVDTTFIVIVAPSLSGTVNAVEHGPDLTNLQAFVATGGQAVTYGVGTWHAPMIVLGKRRVDFVVTQFVNGTEDDCEEVAVEGVDFQLDGLPEGIDVGRREAKVEGEISQPSVRAGGMRSKL